MGAIDYRAELEMGILQEIVRGLRDDMQKQGFRKKDHPSISFKVQSEVVKDLVLSDDGRRIIETMTGAIIKDVQVTGY